MVQRPDLIGQQFGSYRLLHLIGSGDFAEVYLGEHLHLGTQVAIKVFHRQLAPTDINTFRTEARAIARLLHPHIIRVFDFNVTDSTPFLVMDYATGGTIRECHPKGTIVPLATIVSYTLQVADALQYVHDEKLIHQDVKPANILLDEHHNVLLSDFGLSLIAHSSHDKTTQDVVGTAAYMSSEQFRGAPQPASDQYSLGVVVYEWLCGRLPFEGSLTAIRSQHISTPPPPLREKVPTISPEAEQVVMTALHKDPKQRFDTIHAFATALQQASQIEQTQTFVSLHSQIDNLTCATQTHPVVSPHQTNDTLLADVALDIGLQGGCQKWAFSTSDTVYSSPTVVNGTVYFGSNDRNLYALDAASGEKIWSFLTDQRVESSPTVASGIVYFGSNDGKLYALDATSGQQKWSFLTGAAVYSSPTVVDGVVYFGSNDHNLYALDAASGEKIWSFLTGNVVTSAPTVANGIVYFSSDDHSLYALDATSGRKLWSFLPSDFVTSPPTVVGNTVYFGSQDRNLYALHAIYGRQKWSFRTGDALFSAPTVANGVVYCGSTDGNLYALHAASGQQMWSFHIGDALYSSPSVANNVVYVGSNDGNLYALDTTSGLQIWSLHIGNVLLSSPTVVDGVVYIGSDDGNLYAVFA